jgi:hypothetical protein
LKKLANSTTRFLLGFSVSGFPLDVGAVRSRRRRHSSPLGLMWGREDGSVETLDEPHVGNEACPRTSSNPDAVVLGGIPLDDGTPSPGERAGTETPSASSTHGRKVMHEDNKPFLNSNEQLSSASGSSSSPRDTERIHNLLSQRRTFAYQWAIASPLEKVGSAWLLIATVAVTVRLVIDIGDDQRVFWLWWFVFMTWYVLNRQYILPWLQRKHTKLAIEHWRLSGGDALEVSHEPTSCAVNIFGCSPMWRHWTRKLEHETDPTLIQFYTRVRSRDLSRADTDSILIRFELYALMCGALYYVIYGRGRVWGILYLVDLLVCSDFYYIALILRSHSRIQRYRSGYSQAGLDPL